MPIEYHINERDELITVTATGQVTSSEACVCLDELLNDPAFDASLPQLIDLREAQPGGSPEDLRHFETVLLGEYQPKLQALVAIVVNSEWDEAACAKAFWFSCALGTAELFDGWNQACKWLIKKEFSANLVDLADDLAEDLGALDMDPVFEPDNAASDPDVRDSAVTPPS